MADEHKTRRPHTLVRLANILFLAIGIVALVWLVRTVGLALILERIGAISWGWIPLVGLSLAGAALDAGSIHAFLRTDTRPVSYGRVFIAQLSGQAVNSVTPTGTLGEAVKVTMLDGQVSKQRATAAVVLYNVSGLLVWVLFVLIGLATALLSDQSSPEAILALSIGLGVTVAAAAALLLVTHFGLLATLMSGLRHLRLASSARTSAWTRRAQSFDEHLAMFRRRGDRNLRRGLVLVALSRLLGRADLLLCIVVLGGSQAWPSLSSRLPST